MAAIWNPPGPDGERGATDSHMPEMLCLAGGSVVLLPSVFFALLLLVLLLSKLPLRSSWRTNETSVT